MYQKPHRGVVSSYSITLASLASSSGLTVGRAGAAARHGDEWDCLVQFMFKLGTGVAAGQIEMWMSASLDGTNFSGGATGSDAALTPGAKTNMALLDAMPTAASDGAIYRSNLFSLRRVFGSVPPFTLPFVTHNTGQPLDSTAASFFVKRIPIL